MVLKVVVLSLMAMFYISYFSKMFSQRKQGISTDQLGRGKDGIHKFIEIVLKITTYILPILQIFSILFYVGNTHLIVRVEEEFLEETFGQEYITYKDKVSRYFGRKF